MLVSSTHDAILGGYYAITLHPTICQLWVSCMKMMLVNVLHWFLTRHIFWFDWGFILLTSQVYWFLIYLHRIEVKLSYHNLNWVGRAYFCYVSSKIRVQSNRAGMFVVVNWSPISGTLELTVCYLNRLNCVSMISMLHTIDIWAELVRVLYDANSVWTGSGPLVYYIVSTNVRSIC